MKPEAYLAEIDKGLGTIPWPHAPENLYRPMEYILSLGGKRIRPLMVLLGAGMFTDNPLQALPQALGMEIFHNFSLVHDDMMDAAPIRRGKPTVHEKWGHNIGLLAGDGMLVLAYRHMCQCGPDKLPALLDCFNNAAIQVCEGQQMDMDFGARKTISLDEYVEMIRLKTAVLLGASLQTGALVAGAAPEQTRHLYAFGEQLGIAFQIQDDLLDVYGSPEKFGKQAGGDILENKKTWLWVKALETGNAQQKARLLQLLDSTGEDKISQVVRIYDETGIPKSAEEEISQRFKTALDHLSKTDIPENKLQPLRELADMIMARQH